MTDISLRYLLFGEDRSASGSMRKVGDEAHGLSGKVGAAFTGIGDKIGGEVGEVLSKVGEGIESLGDRSKGLAPKLAVGAGALVGVGAALEMISSKEKKAHDQLAQALENVGAHEADYRDEIEKTIRKQEDYGHTAVQTQQALQILVQATRDPKAALADMSVVADLAAAKNMSLADAAAKVAGVYNGQTRILKSFNIQMDSQKQAAEALAAADRKHEATVTSLSKAQQRLSDLEAVDGTRKKLTVAQQIQLRNARDAVKTATENLNKATLNLTAAEERNQQATHATKDAVAQLGDAVKNQAQKSVDNWGGRIDVAKAKLEDWAGKVASFAGGPLTYLGTALGVVTGVMEVFTTWQGRAKAQQEAEAAATVTQTVAQKGAAAATKGWAAAQWLLNAALDANPIGIVVVALAALVAGLVLAWQHSQTFRDFVRGAFHDVGAAATALWEDAIRPAFKFIADLWFTVVGALVNGAASAFGWMPGLGGKLKAAAKHFNAFRDEVNHALSGISDKTVHVNVDLATSHAANIALHKAAPGTIGSARAAGGPVGPGSMYLVGEHGPEVVTFGAAGYVTPNSRTRQLLAGSDAGGIGGQQIVININSGPITRDGARDLDRALRQLFTDTGGRLGLRPT